MPSPTLIIVTGAPASGKTSIAKKLSDSLYLPVFHKDELKEFFYDTIGSQDEEFMHKLGATSFSLLFLIAQNLLSKNISLIIEANFKPEYAEKDILTVVQDKDISIIQIRTLADPEILQERYLKRIPERHPGHMETQTYESIKHTLNNDIYHQMNLPGRYIEVDTTNWNTVDYQELVAKIKNEINQ